MILFFRLKNKITTYPVSDLIFISFTPKIIKAKILTSILLENLEAVSQLLKTAFFVKFSCITIRKGF